MSVTAPLPERHAVAMAGRFALVVAVGLGLGILTAYAQEWLPQEVGSLANSSGSWALVAFALALLAAGPRTAAVFGCLTLLALLAGYVLGAVIRGYPSSTGLMVYWGAAALIAGPLLGLSAHWAKTGRGLLAAVGVGAMSGVLVGEGVYGLAYVAATTYPPYWWGEIVAGVALVAFAGTRRLRGARAVALCVAATVSTAVAFLVLARQNLIALL